MDDLSDRLLCASQWMACNSSFRFIIYHWRCCIRGWSIFFEKDSWMAWMPRAVWWADVLEHEWFLCFIFNTPCSTHPFPPFYSVTSCSSCFSVSSLLFLSCCQWSFLSFYFFSVIISFIFIHVCLSTFTDSHSVSFPIFPLFWLALMLYLFSCWPTVFLFFLFLSSEGWICWKGHGGKFILDGPPVHALCLDSASGWFSVTSQF